MDKEIIKDFEPVSKEIVTEVRREEAVLKAGALQNAILNSANFSREGLHKSSPQPPRALSGDEPNKPRHHRI